MMQRRHLLSFIGLSVLFTAALADTWPNKPVKIVVPYAAGAGLDPVARTVAEKLAEIWKVPVIVDNRPGVNGTVGTASVARQAAPDGYTILFSGVPEVAISQYVMEKMPYDPEKDLRPVTQLASLPLVLVTSSSKPWASLVQFMERARQAPGTLSYSSSGEAGPQHLAMVQLERLGKASMIHVPYKGSAPAITDLLGGQVDVGFIGLPSVKALIEGKKLRALGISSHQPEPSAPDIPRISSMPGYAEFSVSQWFGVFVPAQTPDDVTSRIQASIATVVNDTRVRGALESQGLKPSGMSTADFSKFLAEERQKYARIVKDAKLR